MTELTRCDDGHIDTFKDLLTHPNPPVAVLTMVKEYAKASMDHPSSSLPRPIASAMYYAAIVVARLRCNQMLTQLDDASLLKGLQWALDKPWLGQTLRPLLEEGVKSMDASDSSSSEDHSDK